MITAARSAPERERISSLMVAFATFDIRQLNGLMEPGADDGERLFGMPVDHLADLLDGGFPHLTFDAADIDGRTARYGQCGLGAFRGSSGARRGQGAGGRHRA